ncbi:MAG: PorV/PorQ family protein [Rhodothermales bacterium]|nr:PorV/PorQ family protein [Rhodothermales bacterium]
MKRTSLSLFVLLFCAVSVLPVSAQQFNNVGTSVANFLKIPVGPRGTALGGAYTALADDATSLFWNVAGMTGVQGHEVSFNHNEWLLDLRHEYLAGVFSVGEYNRIGLSLSYLSMGDMEETTAAEPTGTGLEFSAYDMALGLAYARQLTDRFAIGLQTKYVIESIAQSSATGIAFDLGLLFRSEWNDLRIAATIANFGPDLQMTGDNLRTKLDPFPAAGASPGDVPLFLETETFSLPIQFQVGVSMTPLTMESMAFTTTLDVRDTRDFNQEIRVGGELEILNTLYLRGGSNVFLIEGSPFGGGDDVVVEGADDADNTGVGPSYVNPTTITRSDLRDGQAIYNLGVGLNYELPNSGIGFKFDYAFSKIRTLDDAHRFGVSLTF